MSADLQTTQGLFGGSMMAPIPDPYPVYRRVRDEQPVVPMSIPMGDGVAYLVTRYDDVMTVLKDGTLHSSRSNAKGIGLVMGRIIGIPIADYEQFHRWAMDLLGIADAPFKAIAAAQSIVDYLTPVLAERKANPTNDLVHR